MSRIPDDFPLIDFNPLALPPPLRQADYTFTPTDAGAASRAGEVQMLGQTRRGQLESQLPAPDPAELARQKRELMLDLTQMALDLAGLIDPTPISDGANGIVSLFRGDFLGAGISALGMIPYVGDLAKVGKLGKFVKTMERVVEIARVDARFADAVRPVLNQIKGALDQIPFDSLPGAVREPLQALKNKVDEFFSAPAPRDTFTGTLRGAPVTLSDVTVRSITYTKTTACSSTRARPRPSRAGRTPPSKGSSRRTSAGATTSSSKTTSSSAKATWTCTRATCPPANTTSSTARPATSSNRTPPSSNSSPPPSSHTSNTRQDSARELAFYQLKC